MNRRFGMELYEAFVAVAETAGFTAAAERLHRQQNTVSDQIRRLEEKVDRRLFRRTSRRIELTSAGAALLPWARAMLHMHERAIRSVGDSTPDGFRIGMAHRLFDGVFVDLVEIFEGLTGTPPTFQWGRSPELFDQFRRNELDVLIVSRCRNEACGYPVASERVVWAGTGDFEFARIRPLALALGLEDCPHRALATAALEEAGVSFEITYTAASDLELKRTAALGYAVTALSEHVIAPELIEVGEAAGLPEIGCCGIDLHLNPILVEQHGADVTERLGEQVAGAFRHAGIGQPLANP